MFAEHLSVIIYDIRAGRAKSVTKLWAESSRVCTQEEGSDFHQLQKCLGYLWSPLRLPLKKYEGSVPLGRESRV
jgi:hypothetical protein